MKKYYTPSIEEFHIGFEFEIFNHDTDEWDKHTYIENDDVFGLEDCREYYEDLRVKHLDREDIESFGFEISDEYKHTFKESYENGKYSIHLMDNNVFMIYKGSLHNKIFTGVIKNKSELKRVLTQLEYGFE